MPNSRANASLIGAWILWLGVYAGIAHLLGPGPRLASFGDVVQCFVPLFANAGLLINAGTPHWRRNLFWMLLALSCTLWMVSQFVWTYYEVYLHKDVPGLFAGDIIVFLRGIPLMAALALRPHRMRRELHMRLGYLDFTLLMAWWTFMYVYVVLPWMYAAPTLETYNFNYNLLASLQQFATAAGFGLFWLRTRGAWRTVYLHLFGATTLYTLTSLALNLAIPGDKYYTGSPLYDLPLMSSFFWYGFAGLVAYRSRKELELPMEGRQERTPVESAWTTRLAMAAVLSLPVLALYAMRFERDAPAVRDFRLMATLIASLSLTLLVFLRMHLADADRARLLSRSESSIENLQRLQTQMVQSEKLVSLGQLAAGAAHEINNPLTAILGYSDLLAEDQALPERARGTATKIRDQARRTKNLVQNLLRFARQAPMERTLLDINTVVSNAVQLRALDLHGGSSTIEMQLESVLPGVRGDNNQLMQVFFNIISNGVEAMNEAGGGVLTIRTLRDRGSVVVLLSDTGPGIREPHRVFDPFYTTKPIGKGTGLGLSICYGIVQEHGGKIFCYNGQPRGAVFRVELPAVLAALPTHPTRGTTPLSSKTTWNASNER